jgi:hypothetical protein
MSLPSRNYRLNVHPFGLAYSYLCCFDRFVGMFVAKAWFCLGSFDYFDVNRHDFSPIDICHDIIIT